MSFDPQGPVDAAYKAIDSIVAADSRLLEFNVQAVTEGIDALGTVNVRVEEREVAPRKENGENLRGPRTWAGHGADVDIVVASVKAYLSALNKMLVARTRVAPGRTTANVVVAAS